MNESQATWFVSLFGSEHEMEQLRGFLELPNCRLVQAKINKGCYLTSCRFSNLTDSKEVCESAKKLLTMIRAFAKIEVGGDFLSVNVGGRSKVVGSENATTIIRSLDGNVDSKVKADVHVFGITASITFKANVPNVVIQDKDGNVVNQERLARPERWFDYYLNRCDDDIDSNVFDTLYYFAEETSFYSLYKVYETIKEDTDGHPKIDQNCKMVADGWVDYKDLKAFKESANCYGIVRSPEGKYSLRHSPAKCRQGKQYQGAIFDLSQCLDFIKRLLERWLSWKS